MKNKFKEILDKIEKNRDIKYTKDSKILLIDGLNTFLRCFCMINHINEKGNHIGGLTGFLKSVGYAIKIIQPTKVIIVFDGQGASASKKNLYPEYKANRGINRITNYNIFSSREEENESINNQVDRLIFYLQCLPLSLICIDGLEADDIIGYLTLKYEKNEDCNQTTIMSSDKDFLQLISNKTQVYSPTKKKIYQTQQILEEYQIHPNNLIVMKTLLGDDSDNLPGIQGLGPKKLQKLFPQLSSSLSITLNEVLEISKEREDILSQRIIERKNQLDINWKLMNLGDCNISPENINLIENMVFYGLNKPLFLKAYHSDFLGESIPSVETWINNFNDLNFYKNESNSKTKI